MCRLYKIAEQRGVGSNARRRALHHRAAHRDDVSFLYRLYIFLPAASGARFSQPHRLATVENVQRKLYYTPSSYSSQLYIYLCTTLQL